MKNFSLLYSVCGAAIFFASGCFGVAEAKRSVLTPRQNFSNKTQVVQWQASSQSVSEGAGTVRATASLNAASTASISVPFSISGSASSGSDHSAVNGTLTIPAGSTTASVSFTIVNDTLVEQNETLVLTMGTPVGAVLGTVVTHTITITDNDVAPTPTPSPTASPKPSPTPSPTVSPKPSPTPSPTVSPKPSPTPSPTVSPKPSPTPSPTSTVAASCPANTICYYVSRADGNDTNCTGRAPTPYVSGINQACPFQSTTKVNAIFASLNPGERILFKRGESFEGTIRAVKSGTSTAPITIGPYGTGAKPIIQLGRQVTNWVPYSGNVYVTDYASDVSQLFLNDKRLTLARYPNEGYLTIQGISGANSILTNAPLSSAQVIGAEVRAKFYHWMIVGGTATGFSGGLINFSSPDSLTLTKGYGFFLANKQWMLDAPGEWFYDSATRKLYVWTPNGDSPANHKVIVSAYDDGITISQSVNNISVDDLEIRYPKKNGIGMVNSTNCRFTNLTIYGAGNGGIHGLNETNGMVVRNSLIDNSGTYGIRMGLLWGTNTGVIENNVIRNTMATKAELINNLRNDFARGAALGFGMNSIVRNNRISNSGYSGMVASGNGSRIEFNYVEKSCLATDDGGGIYINGGNGNIVSQNIVIDTMGSLAGTSSLATEAYGIYMDDRASNTSVLNNTVSNSRAGIYLHNTTGSIVRGNTVHQSRAEFMMSHEDAFYFDQMINNVVENNVLHSNLSEAPSSNPLSPYAFYGGNGGFGTYNYNHFLYKIPSRPLALTRYSGILTYRLPEWQINTGQDRSSIDVTSYFKFGGTEDTKLLYNDGAVDQTYNVSGQYCTLDNVAITTPINLKPFTSKMLLGCFCNKDTVCNNKESAASCPSDCGP